MSANAARYIAEQIEEGRSFTDIAYRLNTSYAQLDGVPHRWTAKNVEYLSEAGHDRTITLQREGEDAPVPELSDAPREISEQEYRRVTMFWIRVIGWIVLVWAILTVAGSIWFAVEWNRIPSDDEDTSSLSSMSSSGEDDSVDEFDFENREDCLAEASTTYEECDEAFPVGS